MIKIFYFVFTAFTMLTPFANYSKEEYILFNKSNGHHLNHPRMELYKRDKAKNVSVVGFQIKRAKNIPHKVKSEGEKIMETYSLKMHIPLSILKNKLFTLGILKVRSS